MDVEREKTRQRATRKVSEEDEADKLTADGRQRSTHGSKRRHEQRKHDEIDGKRCGDLRSERAESTEADEGDSNHAARRD